ncbi:putative hydrolase YugF [Desulfosarcina widdelii]|uniref:Putative hydrolase YugF n=1 Tax=Desulfosarcina widdelii TaxID=947919 RepID=A0A5K7Z909_9BACT|nr:alpha/beta hydrolase [Desulfosarcina widdelii]BBO78512.1 putative hydrolase YugF [Desulfosarcina widdelii]
MVPDQPSNAEIQFIEMQGGVAAYTDEGFGPVLVCVHGVPGSTFDFRWLAPALSQNLRVIRIDLPGFGKTPRAAHPGPDMDGMAQFILRFIDSIGLDSVSLLGHSLGGAIATQAAAMDERILAIVLVSSAGPYSHRGHFPKTYKALLPLACNPVTRPLIVSMGRKALRWAGFHIGNSDETVLTALECAASINFKRHGETLKKLTKPTMVIWAEDDRIVEPRISEILKEIAPSGPRLHFETGGHNIQKMRAIEIAQMLCPWIQEEVNPFLDRGKSVL